ncbi:hypothetical protein BU17DRAFT_94798 [Hysterangium stoloniferum]|nr:hypothetical protein BU17DRAFT_94798 [Hysterangium stoloniferum]
MTDEEHAAFLEREKSAPSMARHWSKNTKHNVYSMDKKWTAYCAKYNLGDPEEALPMTDRARAMDFLTFMCENYDINTTDTLWQCFRVWKQLYHLYVGEEFNSVDSEDVYHFYKEEVIRAYRFKNSQTCVKTVTDSSDLLAMMIHNIAYDKLILPDERVRLVVAASYLILGYTGCRPAEIVDASDPEFEDDLPRQSPRRPNALCYEDITLFVCRHPDTGEHCLGMAIKFTHHKGHDNKLKPTIFFFYQTRRVMLDLVTLMISLAILGPDGLDYLPLQWKKEWLNLPVFRNSNDDSYKPMSYRTLYEYTKDHSLNMGYPEPIGPKDWRRNVGNTANKTTTGPERDLTMRHTEGSNIFRTNYLNQVVDHDMIAAVLYAPSQDSLLRKLSHARDRRAKRDMVSPEVWAVLKKEVEAPDIQDMLIRREELKAEAKGLSIERATEKRHVISRYHKFYFKKAPKRDLDRQLNGDTPIEYTPPTIECQLPERATVAMILSQQSDNLNAQELRSLRIEVCSLFVRLGRLREPSRPRDKQFLSQLTVPASQSSPSHTPDFDNVPSPEALSSPPPFSPLPLPSKNRHCCP